MYAAFQNLQSGGFPSQFTGSSQYGRQSSAFGNFNLFGNLDRKAIKHVRTVYSSLFAAILSLCFGVYIWMSYEFNLFVACLGLLASTLMLFSTSHVPEDKQALQKRQFILCLCAFFKGLVIAPIVEENLFTALGCTTLIFGSLTAAAFTAKRREYFFLGGMLGSALSVMCFISFINMFVGSYQLFSAQLYIGLFIFIGYVLFNTQVMLERAITQTYPDPIHDAFQLFTDFAAILVRLAIILGGRREKKRRN